MLENNPEWVGKVRVIGLNFDESKENMVKKPIQFFNNINTKEE